MNKYIVLCLSLITSLHSYSQQWVVGQPVNQNVIPSAIGYSALQGCYPSPSVKWTLNIPTVPGVQFSFVVKTADANSMYITPGNDTLAVGDTIALSGGSNVLTVYYFVANPPTLPLAFDFVATGIPAQAGSPYPCNINQLFLFSNLLFCPDGLSGAIPTNCSVLNNTGVNDLFTTNIHLQLPSAENGQLLKIENVPGKFSLKIYSSSGDQIFVRCSNNQNCMVDLSYLKPGIYVVQIDGDNLHLFRKFSLIR